MPSYEAKSSLTRHHVCMVRIDRLSPRVRGTLPTGGESLRSSSPLNRGDGRIPKAVGTLPSLLGLGR